MGWEKHQGGFCYEEIWCIGFPEVICVEDHGELGFQKFSGWHTMGWLGLSSILTGWTSQGGWGYTEIRWVVKNHTMVEEGLEYEGRHIMGLSEWSGNSVGKASSGWVVYLSFGRYNAKGLSGLFENW